MLTQAYAHQCFAYATGPYKDPNTKHKHGGLKRGSTALWQVIKHMLDPVLATGEWYGIGWVKMEDPAISFFILCMGDPSYIHGAESGSSVVAYYWNTPAAPHSPYIWTHTPHFPSSYPDFRCFIW